MEQSKVTVFNAVVLLSMIFLMIGQETLAQSSVKDSVISMFTIDLNLGFQSPAGDLANRFGSNAALGGGVHYKTERNWEIGMETQFMFGSRVNDPVTSITATADGYHIDQNGNFVNLLFLERGFTIVGTIGKVIPLFGPNPNSGLIIRGGAGLLQHKILLESRVNDVPQLEGDYLKGYDRLTNGLTLHEFIGYRYMGNNRFINITFGFEGYQAFTQSRRDFDFDLMKKDDNKRNDMLYGMKLIWSFPIYRRASTGYYIN
jgi:hypothetical protein